MRIPRQLLEGVLIVIRLAAFAESNLIDRDDPIAMRREDINGLLPGGRTKILPMKKHCGLAVRRPRGDIHIGHLQRLTLRREREISHREGVSEALEFLAEGRLRRQRLWNCRLSKNHTGHGQERYAQHDPEGTAGRAQKQPLTIATRILQRGSKVI
jgi:hypothetical protein